MTAPTSEGALYEVDMRLRPSGRSGPLATRLESFQKYQAEEAWTWEHMTLTRGRIVYGPGDLLGRTRAAINAILSEPRERESTLVNAAEMRTRLIEANPSAFEQPLNVKLSRGGLVDIDFILQTRLLLAGCGDVATVTAKAAMAALSEANHLTDEERATVSAAHHLQTAILQFSRLALDAPLSQETASPALSTAIARALEEPDFAAVEARLADAHASIRAIYEVSIRHMTLPVIHHPDYQASLKPTHRFPMSKYGYLREALRTRGLLTDDPAMQPEAAPEHMIARAHDPGYVSRAIGGTLSKDEVRRIGLPQTEQVIRRSRLAGAGSLLAARHALETGIACNAAGGSHHAARDHGAGYCVFNDVAIAIRALQHERAVRRCLVIDCDVHQGDGTAAIFATEQTVLTLSIHAQKNFPFRKVASDLDIGLADGMEDGAYLAALNRALTQIGVAGPFDLIFYNAGVDVHGEDRLGRLALTDEGIRARDAVVLGWARARGEPIVGVLGGGYGDDPRDIAARHAILFEEAAKLA